MLKSHVVHLSPAVTEAIQANGKMGETHDQVLRRILSLPEDANYWSVSSRKKAGLPGKPVDANPVAPVVTVAPVVATEVPVTQTETVETVAA